MVRLTCALVYHFLGFFSHSFLFSFLRGNGVQTLMEGQAVRQQGGCSLVGGLSPSTMLRKGIYDSVSGEVRGAWLGVWQFRIAIYLKLPDCKCSIWIGRGIFPNSLLRARQRS